MTITQRARDVVAKMNGRFLRYLGEGVAAYVDRRSLDKIESACDLATLLHAYDLGLIRQRILYRLVGSHIEEICVYVAFDSRRTCYR